MKKLRTIVLVHKDLIPPEKTTGIKIDDAEWKTEYWILKTLKKLGHEVLTIGLYNELKDITKAIDEWNPHIIFNLLVEFNELSIFDQNIVSYLELKKIPYTGCNPRGLMLTRDKALCKQILYYHEIPTAKFHVFSKNNAIKLPSFLQFPTIVKSLTEEASMGISQASIVQNEQNLQERVKFIHDKIQTDAIVESFIEGREFYVGILGNKRLEAFPVWELCFNNVPENFVPIATSRVKWNEKYRKKYKIRSKIADIEQKEQKRIQEFAKNAYKKLGLNGYARMDMRYTPGEEIYIIEVNPNPGIAPDEEFPISAKKAGIDYESLIGRILSLGLSWHEERL